MTLPDDVPAPKAGVEFDFVVAWPSISTEDGSLSAHFELSVAVTAAGARVLGTDRMQ